MINTIAQVVVGLPVEGPFDYLIPREHLERIAIGARVFVPFGNRKLVGYVVGLKAASPFKKLKSLFTLIDESPLLDRIGLDLAREISLYYGCSWGEAIEATLPDVLRKGKSTSMAVSLREGTVLSDDETISLKRIASVSAQNIQPRNDKVKKENQIILLHDTTGKQTWPSVFEEIKEAVSLNLGALICVPETSQIGHVIEGLSKSLGQPVISLDTKLSSKKYFENWSSLKRGEQRIAVGSRSAIFAPIASLGLIVVHDEDNAAYKQDQSPFYHAREVARIRSKLEPCKLLLTNIVPSLEIWQGVKKKQITLLSVAPQDPIATQIIDTSRIEWQKGSAVSYPVKTAIERTLSERGKILLFMNRKGFSTMTRCQQCGFTLKCKRCDVNLTYLFSKKKMVCRHCGYTTQPPLLCPECRGSYMKFSGQGIEKLESEMARLFPQARIAHFDNESPALEDNFDILIATQAVLRFEGVLSFDTVAILRADSEINRFDMHAAQRSFGLFMRLKAMTRKKMLIQTALADNYIIKALVKSDFEKFYREELKTRRQTDLSPFKHLVAVTLRGDKEEKVLESAGALFDVLLKLKKPKDIDVLDPQPDAIPKLRGKFRFTILVKGRFPEAAVKFIKAGIKTFHKKHGMIISVNVDP